MLYNILTLSAILSLSLPKVKIFVGSKIDVLQPYQTYTIIAKLFHLITLFF